MGLVVHPDVVSVGVDLRTPDELRTDLIASLAALRWGSSQRFTLAADSDSPLAPVNGYHVPNDSDAKTNILGALDDLRGQDAGATRRWKFADTDKDTVWLDLTNDGLSQLKAAMDAAQQAAYDREEELTKILRTSDDPASVDVMTGWPD